MEKLQEGLFLALLSLGRKRGHLKNSVVHDMWLKISRPNRRPQASTENVTETVNVINRRIAVVADGIGHFKGFVTVKML